ncbi:hypothetical protein MUK42_22085 [Musa troglodytarum]|uniref:Uncharacterized protein n=1 Tax=Musa troglodytarum TaxID=320322 RepID=A0A9E7KBA2_9LILI|nr:hypothetical protein MUK42_22085 [Musa troglodytarum]
MESKRFRFGLGSGSSGGSRKGRKSSLKRPKQPQRGLGVAQLEKIRLQSQMNGYVSSIDFSFPSDLNMVFPSLHLRLYICVVLSPEFVWLLAWRLLAFVIPPLRSAYTASHMQIISMACLMQEDSKVKVAAPSSPSSSGSPTLALHPNMVGHGDDDKRSFNYVEHWSDASARSQLNEASIYPWHYRAHPVALPLFQQSIEDAFTAQDSAQKTRRHDRSLSVGSIGQISDPNETQELDLELRLSL